ncbi:hypothetical protein B0H63DRAFT_515151 [Podospora didyma]|uniref:Peptidase S1 domain-containing protein n=1 Tax=Podospora didyma TaxID=330526 RepID=A0AAE0K2R4_9PEZI|nr:hypothetical protein B0H63DRAFT_515151 [Podospora didyma]
MEAFKSKVSSMLGKVKKVSRTAPQIYDTYNADFKSFLCTDVLFYFDVCSGGKSVGGKIMTSLREFEDKLQELQDMTSATINVKDDNGEIVVTKAINWKTTVRHKYASDHSRAAMRLTELKDMMKNRKHPTLGCEWEVKVEMDRELDKDWLGIAKDPSKLSLDGAVGWLLEPKEVKARPKQKNNSQGKGEAPPFDGIEPRPVNAKDAGLGAMERTVVTNGHVVTGYGSHVISVTATIGFSNHDPETGQEIHIVACWPYFTSKQDQYDLAMIRVDPPFETGLAYEWAQTPTQAGKAKKDDKGANLIYAGFPAGFADPKNPGKIMYESDGWVAIDDSNSGPTLKHHLPTEKGASEAPIFSLEGDTKHWVVAVHRGGNQKFGAAVRLHYDEPNDLNLMHRILKHVPIVPKQAAEMEKTSKEEKSMGQTCNDRGPGFLNVIRFKPLAKPLPPPLSKPAAISKPTPNTKTEPELPIDPNSFPSAVIKPKIEPKPEAATSKPETFPHIEALPRPKPTTKRKATVPKSQVKPESERISQPETTHETPSESDIEPPPKPKPTIKRQAVTKPKVPPKASEAASELETTLDAPSDIETPPMLPKSAARRKSVPKPKVEPQPEAASEPQTPLEAPFDMEAPPKPKAAIRRKPVPKSKTNLEARPDIEAPSKHKASTRRKTAPKPKLEKSEVAFKPETLPGDLLDIDLPSKPKPTTIRKVNYSRIVTSTTARPKNDKDEEDPGPRSSDFPPSLNPVTDASDEETTNVVSGEEDAPRWKQEESPSEQ